MELLSFILAPCIMRRTQDLVFGQSGSVTCGFVIAMHFKPINSSIGMIRSALDHLQGALTLVHAQRAAALVVKQ